MKHLCWKGWVAAFLLAAPMASLATSCTTQAELLALDRDALAAAGGRLAEAVVQQDYAALQAALLPAEAIEAPISPIQTGATFSAISQPHVVFMRLM